MTRTIKWVGIGLVAAVAGACAGQPPTRRLEATEAAIRGAEGAGASRTMTAAAHLQRAKDLTDSARSLIAKEDYERSGSQLVRAESEAYLAQTLANSAAEQSAAQLAVRRVEDLKRSIPKQGEEPKLMTPEE
jgi:hypothetical protein